MSNRNHAIIIVVFTIVSILLTNQAVAATWYVSVQTGDDRTGHGTLEMPFKSVSKAIAKARLGDTCVLREGIYRELVRPENDDLTIEAYAEEAVTISGCDLVTSRWFPVKGRAGVLQTVVPDKVLQVFVDGARMNPARFPNYDSSQDMFRYTDWAPTTTTSVSFDGPGYGQVVFDDGAGLPDDGENTWVGGYYTGRNGRNPFTAATGFIRSSKGNTLNVEDLSFYWRRNKTAASNVGPGRGYIINHLRALDSVKEWYWEKSSGTLYLYPPHERTIASTKVEARIRLWGLDVSGRRGIVVKGIHFLAASVKMEDSQQCLLSECRIEYPSPWANHVYGNRAEGTAGHDYGGVIDGTCGVFVSGENNVVERCHISKSWGSGIRLEGRSNTVRDCLVEDVDWLTRRMHGIQAFGQNNRVLFNTVRRCAQAGIDGGNRSIVKKVAHGLVVRNNRVDDVALVNSDCGAFYINLQGAAANLEVAYNVFQGVRLPELTSVIYLDNATSHASVHHNLVIGDQAIHGIKASGSDIDLYNNTILDADYSIFIIKAKTLQNVSVQNNLSEKPLRGAFPENFGRNITDIDLSIFMDAGSGDFRLRPDSDKAIDTGVVHAAITDGFMGKAPDMGAFESGQPAWPAGSTLDKKHAFRVASPSEPENNED